MSLVLRPLNAWLRLTVKRQLARIQDPTLLRRDFERKAHLFFRGPRGVGGVWDDMGGCRVLHLHEGSQGARVILYLHGGAYVFGSPLTHRAMLGRLVRRTGWSAVLPRYRLAPEHPCPAALEDAVAVYRALSDTGRDIVIGGDSAGGGLALCLLAEILRLGLPIPVAAFAFSPLTDMTFSGESFRTNVDRDAVLPAARAQDMTRLYLGAMAPDDPRASPLFADFSGAPPVWLAVAESEILRDDTRRMAARLREQGVAVQVEEAGDLPHVWPLFHNILPEGRRTLDSLAGWISSLSPPRSGS